MLIYFSSNVGNPSLRLDNELWQGSQPCQSCLFAETPKAPRKASHAKPQSRQAKAGQDNGFHDPGTSKVPGTF